MTEPVVYRDSPLGDYLEGISLSPNCLTFLGTGTYDADWRVLPEQEEAYSDQDSPISEHDHRDFAPPSRLPNRKFNTRQLKRLVILDENVSRSAKFYNLFSVRFAGTLAF
jgi:hypothetical protein